MSDQKMKQLYFASDNCAPVYEAVMDKLREVNEGYAPAYGEDEYSRSVLNKLEELFEGDCSAYFVQSGTGANIASLAAVCPSFGGILCGADSHLNTSEAGGVERQTGAKILPIVADGNKLTPELIDAYLEEYGHGGRHQNVPMVVSITQATEYGLVYTPQEVKAIGDYAHKNGMLLHMDGARFFNALASLACTPKELTKDAGVDILSLGFSKNGTMFGDAVVLFSDIPGFLTIQKATGQLLSKSRYIAAQIDAMLTDQRYLNCASSANQAAEHLAGCLDCIPGAVVVYPVESNQVIAAFPDSVQKQLHESVSFFDWGEAVRFVCSFDTRPEDVEELARRIAAAIFGD